FRFGFFSSMSSIVSELGQAAPDLIIGRLISLDAVAFFSRAEGLLRLLKKGITNSVVPVAQTWFAEGNRKAPHLLKRDFLKASAMLRGLSWPFYAFMIVAAREVTLVLYGNQWLPIVHLSQILCIGA